MNMNEAYRLIDEEAAAAREWIQIKNPEASEQAVNAYVNGIRTGMLKMYSAIRERYVCSEL